MESIRAVRVSAPFVQHFVTWLTSKGPIANLLARQQQQHSKDSRARRETVPIIIIIISRRRRNVRPSSVTINFHTTKEVTKRCWRKGGRGRDLEKLIPSCSFMPTAAEEFDEQLILSALLHPRDHDSPFLLVPKLQSPWKWLGCEERRKVMNSEGSVSGIIIFWLYWPPSPPPLPPSVHHGQFADLLPHSWSFNYRVRQEIKLNLLVHQSVILLLLLHPAGPIQRRIQPVPPIHHLPHTFP